ncbi:MAG: alpha/beta hydrolase [Chloroflexi bacterium]|jgi:pimeloyl-ACP methyl ester carboxylesterase|nr:alpha/beta hydrolase [Chloroflexota bacterium]
MENAIYTSIQGQAEIMSLYQAALDAWPVPYQTRTVPTRCGDTFVLTCGDKACPPLLLIHGASSNATAWIGDVADYSRHFHVLAVDVIGEPGKSAPSRPAWAGPAYAQWLADVIEGLGLEQVLLVGISQGGWIALRYASVHPERVIKMVLLAPAGVVPTEKAFLLRAMLYTLLGRWGAGRLNRYVFGPQPIDPQTLRFMNAILVHFRARIDREYLFQDAELEQVTMPVLFVGGEQDVIRSAGKIEARLRAHLPHLHSQILPGSGHVLVHTSGQILPFLTR